MTDPLDQPIYTITQVAEWLQISNTTATQLATKEDWPRFRVGNRIRFTATHLAQILERLETKPTQTEPRQKVGSRSRNRK